MCTNTPSTVGNILGRNTCVLRRIKSCAALIRVLVILGGSSSVCCLKHITIIPHLKNVFSRENRGLLDGSWDRYKNGSIAGNGSDGPCSWAVDTGSFQRSYSSQPAAASHQIVLANKGSRLLSLDRNTNLIQMWDRDTAEPVRTVRTLNDAHHMTLIGDGTQVAVLCQEGSITTIVVVNLKDNKEVLCITSGEKLAAPHQSWTTKNGRFLVFLYLESEPDNCAIYDLRIFDLEKGSEQDPIKVDTNVHCLKPCGQDMLVLGVRGHAVIWQSSVGAWDMSKFNGWLAHASQVFSKKRKLMEDVAVTCVSISPHEEHMATAGEDGSIIVWGNMLQSKKTHGTQGRPLRGHKHMVSSSLHQSHD